MEQSQVVLCFSVSRNQIPEFNPEKGNLTEKILDHVGDFKNLEEVVSKLTEKLNLTESQVASIRKTLVKAEEEAVQVRSPAPPLKSAANPSSKSKKKNMKKQASKQQKAELRLLDPADAETIEAMKKEILTTVDLLKIVQHLHRVLFPTRVGVRQVRASSGDKISGQVRAGNKVSGLVRTGNIISEQVRAGNVSEQAGLRKHVGNRWE
ncbi:uncharacterized protein LOC17888524 isoform X2 [Capsella rubella]|uniref:uncharacterized protein LOC17888524 isoform X2 n=1 Tax=Capsella rubella TaxID=81985 RepID=UPI000CD5620A|nr:uncharacterized protein LOC17888524 isoform X2 [Capsella rubella]